MEFVSVSQLNDLLIKFCDDCPAVRSKKEESKDKSFFQSPWFFLKEYQRFVPHILLFLKREISAMFRRSATPGAKSNNCGKLQDTRPWTTIPVVKMFTFNYCQSFRFIHLRQPAAYGLSWGKVVYCLAYHNMERFSATQGFSYNAKRPFTI